MWEGVCFLLQFLILHTSLLKPSRSLNIAEGAHHDGFFPLLSPNSTTNTLSEKPGANVNLKIMLNPSCLSQSHHQ